jgi:ketosteroid isomerase-like protein
VAVVGEEELEWLRRVYTPVADGGLWKTRPDGVVANEILAHCDPEIDWRPHLIGRVEGHTYRGHDGMADWSHDIADVFEEMQPELHELTRAGDHRVLVILTLGFRGRGSGLSQHLRLGHLWTFQDGLAVRFESFSESEARAASAL